MMETGYVSLQGDRPNNQDRYALFYDQQSCLLVLADGLGGHPKGEVAAQIMCNICEQVFARSAKPLASPRIFFQQCVNRANELINRYGQNQRPPIAPMTTVVMAIIQNGYCHWSYAGDSRFYLLRDNQILVQSTDHSVLRNTSVNGNDASARLLTRCIGSQERETLLSIEPDISLQPGDILLLCSDGLWNQVTQKQLVQTLWNVFPLDKALHMLADIAENSAKNNSDNISAVGIRADNSTCGIMPSSTSDNEEVDLLAAIDHLNELIDNNLSKDAD